MRALIVKDPWAKQIVQGYKDEEYRTRPTNIRERIGIIEAGTKTVIGEVDLVGCMVELDRVHNRLYEGYVWKLRNPKEYIKPKPYKHSRGAQVWVKI